MRRAAGRRAVPLGAHGPTPPRGRASAPLRSGRDRNAAAHLGRPARRPRGGHALRPPLPAGAGLADRRGHRRGHTARRLGRPTGADGQPGRRRRRGLAFLPFVWRGWLGGADALLLAAVGAWQGWRVALWTAWWTALAGGGDRSRRVGVAGVALAPPGRKRDAGGRRGARRAVPLRARCPRRGRPRAPLRRLSRRGRRRRLRRPDEASHLVAGHQAPLWGRRTRSVIRRRARRCGGGRRALAAPGSAPSRGDPPAAASRVRASGGAAPRCSTRRTRRARRAGAAR